MGDILGSGTVEMNMDMVGKRAAYEALIKKRKGFTFRDKELTNPVDTPYDKDYIEPWAQWQDNLDASIVVVGQEFCDVETFYDVKGTVERYPDRFEYPANRNLQEYLASIGVGPGHPLSPNRDNPVFFTNAVMGLKNGSMSSNFSDRWLEESRVEFLEPLLKIIEPRVIIPIGTKATKTLGRLFGFPGGSHASMVASSPIRTSAGPLVFPVYHTGGLGLRNRPKAKQVEDWLRIKAYL
jgi:hypothetical protein